MRGGRCSRYRDANGEEIEVCNVAAIITRGENLVVYMRKTRERLSLAAVSLLTQSRPIVKYIQ